MSFGTNQIHHPAHLKRPSNRPKHNRNPKPSDLRPKQCLTPLPLPPPPPPPSSHEDAPSPAPSPATESPETRREAPGMPFNHIFLPRSAAAADKPTCPPIARTGARSTGTTSVRGAMSTKFAAARRPGIVGEEERRDWW
ncbi:hypothetical protein E2P81_ATG10574 [Venturia nashicola]|nr:hypothetical protein E2P81_ATG10574 [Venturia nashicola]